MKRRLLILTEIISPYRIPLFNTLAHDESVDLHVIFLAETDSTLRQWRIYKEEIKFSYQVLPAWRMRWGGYNLLLNRGVAQALAAANPDVILCGGYNYIASWQALLWARAKKLSFLLWSESNLQDLRGGHAIVEFLKRRFLRMCTGFVVPGRSALEYLRAHRIEEARIVVAPNAVDNELFRANAAIARTNAASLRRELELPERYFLFVGRLVSEKGAFDLLSAYAKLDASLREHVGLVFAGDGESRRLLERQAASIAPGVVRFAGFVQREELAQYYALADALVLPTYTDPWGLVVNEAMACGLPVILSRAAGCASDLLRDDETGLLIPPRNVEALARAMRLIAEQPEIRASMGARAGQYIRSYSPEAWAKAVAGAFATTGSPHD